MHELSVCQSLLRQVSQIAKAHHAAAVEKIYLQVGPLSGVEPGLLQNAFPVARANTVASKAELVIQVTPVRVMCSRCNNESDVTMNNLVCTTCGEWQTRLLSGDELLLERIDMQTEH